jgi:hypothetical protein
MRRRILVFALGLLSTALTAQAAPILLFTDKAEFEAIAGPTDITVTFERKVPRVPGCDGVIFCYGTIDDVLNIREADISVWNVSNGVLAPQGGGAYAELSPIDGPFHAVGFDVSAPNAFVSVSLGPRGGMATIIITVIRRLDIRRAHGFSSARHESRSIVRESSHVRQHVVQNDRGPRTGNVHPDTRGPGHRAAVSSRHCITSGLITPAVAVNESYAIPHVNLLHRPGQEFSPAVGEPRRGMAKR